MKDFQPLNQSSAYSAAATSVNAPASATDVFEIAGSASKIIKVRAVILSGTETTSAQVIAKLVKRSTANSGGTSATLTNVPFDSSSAAATAVCKSYTANPTTGTPVGDLLAVRFSLPSAATSSPIEQVFSFSNGSLDFPVVLHGTAQTLAVNFNGVTLTGNSLCCTFIWTEE